MSLGSSRLDFVRRLAALVAAVVLLVAPGCGGSEEEPSEVPASPPPGKGLPRFAMTDPVAPRPGR